MRIKFFKDLPFPLCISQDALHKNYQNISKHLSIFVKALLLLQGVVDGLVLESGGY